jgi:DNA-binding SARP family transcriptional activator
MAVGGDLRVLVLGPLTVEFEGRVLHVAGSHRVRLLAFLASRPGRNVSVDAIVDAVWGEGSAERGEDDPVSRGSLAACSGRDW